MKTIFLYMLLLFCYLLIGCETVIDLDLPQSQQRLVVEGRIEKVKGVNSGMQRIRLSLTEDFFNTELPPVATGASVLVTDASGRSWEFAESTSEPGLYSTDSLFAEIDMTYTLLIQYDGEEYEAQETLHAVPPIDSIYQVFVEENEFEDEGLRARIDYRDPINEQNYYLWEQYADGELQLVPDPGNKFNLIASDEFYNGQQVVGYEPNEEAILEPGQTVMIRQVALSQQTYSYYFIIFEQTSSADLFDPPPATIRGNVVNKTNSDNYALGYFSAAEVAERSLVIVPVP
ncbi:MAG: DUF4249 domain-containing protein [Calditrichota bacterium]